MDEQDAPSQSAANSLPYNELMEAYLAAQARMVSASQDAQDAGNRTTTSTRWYSQDPMPGFRFGFEQGRQPPSPVAKKPKPLETVKSGGKRSIILDGGV